MTVARDWDRCARGVLWSQLLADMPDLPTEVREFGVADLPALLAAGTADDLLLQHLDSSDVLVVNWDTVNGDPDFGADFAMRWFEHRRLEILAWVSNGGVLLVEGQATLGVPSQRAYDAVLDVGEVSVCGPQDPLRPEVQRRRYGHSCRLTRRAAKSAMFADFSDPRVDSSDVDRTYEEMLPGLAARVLSPRLKTLDWNMLYRGWFRTNPVRGRRLRWVSLLTTADRQWWTGRFNHPVLLGARLGKGAIVVSTMFLASTQQRELVACLLRNTDGMPVRGGLVRPVVDFVRKNAVPVLAGLAAAPLIGTAGSWDATGTLAKLAQALVTVVAFFVVGLATKLLHGLVRLVKEMLGY
ncbi:MAG TPA: hypothetical protein VF519_06375 [Mycobacteriales bacterium]